MIESKHCKFIISINFVDQPAQRAVKNYIQTALSRFGGGYDTNSLFFPSNIIDITTEKVEDKGQLPEPYFMIGQRVLVPSEDIGRLDIGIVVQELEGKYPLEKGKVRVHCPSKGYDSLYSIHNIKPLPNGQL